jgi:hypothetical protein
MERLRPGEVSEPPSLAPPVPPPPAGSYRPPRTPPRVAPPAAVPLPDTPSGAETSGTLEVHVQPVTADVTIDGQRWLSSDAGHLVVELPAGTHRVEVSQKGYRTLSTEVTVSEGENAPLNVSLMADIR